MGSGLGAIRRRGGRELMAISKTAKRSIEISPNEIRARGANRSGSVTSHGFFSFSIASDGCQVLHREK